MKVAKKKKKKKYKIQVKGSKKTLEITYLSFLFTWVKIHITKQ